MAGTQAEVWRVRDRGEAGVGGVYCLPREPRWIGVSGDRKRDDGGKGRPSEEEAVSWSALGERPLKKSSGLALFLIGQVAESRAARLAPPG